MIDRREFVSAAVAALGLGSFPTGAAVAAAHRLAPGTARAQYADYLNRRFQFEGLQNSRSTDAVLREIVQLPGDRHLEQFELVFRAPRAGELSEGIYSMKSPAGECSPHLVQPLAGIGADRNFVVHFCLLT